MAGGIVMAIILVLVFPVAFLMGMAALAAALGHLVKTDADRRAEGSELLELNR